MWHKLLAEIIGTFILVLVVLLGFNSWQIALGFFIAILIAGPFSGGYINPAVSLGGWLQGDLTGSTFWRYVIAQLLAAAAAYYVAKWLRSGQRKSECLESSSTSV